MSTINRFYYGSLGFAGVVIGLHLVGVYTLSHWTAVLLYSLLFGNSAYLILTRTPPDDTPCIEKSDHRFEHVHTYPDGAEAFACTRCKRRIIMHETEPANAAGFTNVTPDHEV